MTRTKAITPTITDNIWRILKYVAVPLRKFSVNFGHEQFNYTFPALSADGLPEDELKNC